MFSLNSTGYGTIRENKPPSVEQLQVMMWEDEGNQNFPIEKKPETFDEYIARRLKGDNQ